LVAKGLKQ
jgi:hypothetical protein